PKFLQNLFKDFKDPGPPQTFPPQGLPGLGSPGQSCPHAISGRERPAKESKKTKKSSKEDKKRKFLDTFCTNVTVKAKKGELDRIIGRDKEIERVIQILSRRTKNNPCLIGEPGVGKTAIAEGIAQRLVAGDVPFRLQKKEVYLLDLTVLIAGTQFRGQFESRVKSLVEEIKNDGNIIIFIDELHNLVGTGDSEGTMNAANMFKPALSRGEMQVIGATTFGEYRKHIEKDGALERRFQPVVINEPTLDETVELLKGIKNYYEEHHKIKVSDSMLRSCAVLSERYINDRFLPDKAIDLLDESAACASIRNNDLNLYEKLKAENLGLDKKEKDIMSMPVEEIDYEKIAELKTIMARNEQKICELEPIVSQLEITENDISTVIELWTGIPAAKILETEFRKIARLEDTLKEKVIGQDEACNLVAAAIRRSRVRLSMRRRPSSFIFVGPTGVGKTELVKILAGELFDSVEPLIRLDMSEFMEKHSVSRIIGSPPGYIGYDEAGQLTEKVRRKPYSVVLFDEIEKAHPDVMNILLQILDEGKVNDAHGRTVSFENTVIAMTSNAGSTDKSTGLGFAKTEGEISTEKAMKALKEFLRPEFLSRVDEVVVFKPLGKDDYARIVKLMIEEMREPLKEKDIELKVAADVYSYVAEKAFGGKYGGRDIRRVIRDEIENAVAMLIVEKGEEGIKAVNISVKDEKIYVK
ncbi:MAG: ATP-dependent Clp protease ATP-binding subunit, partial [Oscillospiraceae bacterium]|nr:ATP-dependent Clp protease ATP-binding subunit [Oscillospiraceae bacterium]